MCGACSTHNEKKRGVEKIRIEKSFGRCDVNARYELNLEVIKPKGLKPTTVAWIIDTAYSKTDTNNIEIKSEKQKCYVTFKSKGKTRIIAKADSVEKKVTLKTRANKQWILLLFLIVMLGGSVYLNVTLLKSRHKTHSNSLKKKKSMNNIVSVEKEDKSTDAIDYEIKYKKLKKKYNDIVAEYNRFYKEEYERLYDVYESQNDEIARLRQQLEIKSRKSKTVRVNIPDNEKGESKPIKPTKTDNILYGDFIIDGLFSSVTKEPNEDTVFELHINNDYADILIYQQAKRRIIANPAYLDGCEVQYVGKNDVVIEAKGLAQLQTDGKWKVINVLKVIIK